MPHSLARLISIVLHPLLVLPATLLLVAHPGASTPALPLLLGSLALGAVVMGVSWQQVRLGRWRHVDASLPPERRALNRLVLALLMAAAGAAAAAGWMPIAVQLAGAALIVVVALATARVCKLSLHVAMTTYAAALLAPQAPATALIVLALAALLGTARLQLARHTRRDVAAGAVAGLLSGALVHVLAMTWRAA